MEEWINPLLFIIAFIIIFVVIFVASETSNDDREVYTEEDKLSTNPEIIIKYDDYQDRIHHSINQMQRFREKYQDQRLNFDSPLDQCHCILLRMMKIIHDLCKQHNVRYWLHSGSLIGAIRHKGFIPWDGDIDIALLPEDMEKFQERVVPDLPGDLHFQSPSTSKHYKSNDMYKIRDTFSVYSEYTSYIDTDLKDNISHAVQIDLFLFQHLENGNIKHPWKSITTEYDPSLIFPLIEVPFEDAVFYAPNKYHEYLTLRWNDYMIPPPEDKRTPHEGQITAVARTSNIHNLPWNLFNNP